MKNNSGWRRFISLILLVPLFCFSVKIELAVAFGGLYDGTTGGSPTMSSTPLGWSPTSLAVEASSIPEQIDEWIQELNNPAISDSAKSRILSRLSSLILDGTIEVAVKEEIADALRDLLGDSALNETLKLKIISSLRNIVLVTNVSDTTKQGIIDTLANSLEQSSSFGIKSKIVFVFSQLILAKDNAGNPIISWVVAQKITDVLINALSEEATLDNNQERNSYLKIKVLNCLNNIILLTEGQDSRIINSIVSAFEQDLGAPFKLKILSILDYLISAKKKDGENWVYVVSADLKEGMIEFLTGKLQGPPLHETYDASIKRAILTCLKDIILVTDVDEEKKQDIIETLDGILGQNSDYSLKRSILIVLSELMLAKEKQTQNGQQAWVYLVSASLKQQLADFLRTKLITPGLDADTANDTKLRKHIITCLQNIALVVDVDDATKSEIITALTTYFNTDLSFELKQSVLTALSALISGKEKQTQNGQEILVYPVPANLKEGIIEFLKTKLDAQSLYTKGADETEQDYAANNTELRKLIITCLQNIVLVPEVSEAKKIEIINKLTDAAYFDALSFEFKQSVLSVLSTIITAKDKDGNYLVPANLKEEKLIPFLKIKLDAQLDTDTADDTKLKQSIIACLRNIILVPDVSEAKKTEIITKLTTYFDTAGLSFELKQSVLSALSTVITSKDKDGNYLVLPSFKESLITFLKEKLNTTLDSTDAAKDTKLKKAIIACLQNIILVNGVSDTNKQTVITALTTYFNTADLSFELKQSVLSALSTIIIAKDKDGNYLVPVSFKEGLIEFLKTKLTAQSLYTKGADETDEVYAANDTKLRQAIIACLQNIVLVPDVSEAKKTEIITALKTYFETTDLSFGLKQGVLSALSTIIIAKDKDGNYLVPVSFKEGLITFLVDKLDDDILDADEAKDTQLRKTLITCLQNIALVKEASDTNKQAIITALTTYFEPTLSFELKQSVLSALSTIITAKVKERQTQDGKEVWVWVYLVSAERKEQIATFLISQLSGPALDPDDPKDDHLKMTILLCLRKIALVPGVSEDTKQNIVDTLISSLTSVNLSDNVKINIIPNLSILIKDSSVSLALKTHIAENLLELDILRNEDFTDELKRSTLLLFVNFAWVPNLESQTKSDIKGYLNTGRNDSSVSQELKALVAQMLWYFGRRGF